jgi:hypothetical protein
MMSPLKGEQQHITESSLCPEALDFDLNYQVLNFKAPFLLLHLKAVSAQKV